MKLIFAALIASVVLPSSMAVAQEAEPVAAGRIQNTFDASGRTSAVVRTPIQTEADPRAEPAVRAVVGGLQTGTLDYGLFTPDLAAQFRAQEAEVGAFIRELGALESVDWVERREAVDLFLVRFAEADTQWVVGIDDAGRVAAFLFRLAPPIAPENEAASPDAA